MLRLRSVAEGCAGGVMGAVAAKTVNTHGSKASRGAPGDMPLQQRHDG